MRHEGNRKRRGKKRENSCLTELRNELEAVRKLYGKKTEINKVDDRLKRIRKKSQKRIKKYKKFWRKL